jgi:cyclophilin family peptidyl-prolyl cis-trans isomerase
VCEHSNDRVENVFLREVPVMAKKSKREAQKKAPGAPPKPDAASNQWLKYLPPALLAVILLVVALTYVQQQKDIREALSVTDTVKMETSKGTVMVEVYPKLMPVTVANFEKLVKAGFYDGLTWHRVEDWVVQTGDPTATGSGGSDETIPLEVSRVLKNVRGALGMARKNDPNSATSQFYVLKSDAEWLDGGYAVFGKVTSGIEVIDQLTAEDTVTKITIESESSGK